MWAQLCLLSPPSDQSTKTQPTNPTALSSPSLKPGESWQAEYVIRHHQRWWDPPMWDRTSTQPPPPWVPPAAGDDGGDDDLVAEVQGGSGARETPPDAAVGWETSS